MPQAAAYADDVLGFAQGVPETGRATNEQAKLANAALILWINKAEVWSEIQEGRLAMDLELAEIKFLQTMIRNEADHWPKLREQLQARLEGSRAAVAASQRLELNIGRVCAEAAEQTRYGLSGTRLDC